MMNTFQRFINISGTDPDDSRRRKFLNILLVGLGAIAFLLEIVVLSLIPFLSLQERQGLNLVVYGGLILFVGIVVIFFINRFSSGRVAAMLFLILVTTVMIFSDSLAEVAGGRSLFVFTVPIIMASVLLTPLSSFIFAGLSSLIISVIAILINQPPNVPAIAGYFLVALVAWLSSRSLEQTLRELRTINAELDRRVEDRTRELSDSLARERVEAGRMQAILEGIADGVLVFDPNGKSIVANPALSYLLGFPVSGLLGMTMESILEVGETDGNERENILSLLSTPSQDIPNIRFHWRNRTLLVNAAPVQTGGADSIGTVAVFRDFTREAEVEQMKNTFVGMVSHELRTPLNAILGYAEMVREAVYGPITEHQAGILERIEISSRRLLSLVSDLLDQAQIEAGRMKIHNDDFIVSDLVDALHALDKQMSDKGLSLFAEIAPDMPVTLTGDIRRLQQILLNLVGNAIKFTETGGISVRVHRVGDNQWGFDVTDTGPGITPDAQKYVFDSFRQVEGGTTREHGGIGLGLAIVKSLVGLMGGNVSISSEIDKGTTFIVTFPLEPESEKK